MDDMHTAPAVQALKMGYDVLLEKPMANTEAECKQIAQAAAESGRVLSVCHVLRYTPFYSTFKKLIDDGVPGKVLCVQQIENVGSCYLFCGRKSTPVADCCGIIKTFRIPIE